MPCTAWTACAPISGKRINHCKSSLRKWRGTHSCRAICISWGKSAHSWKFFSNAGMEFGPVAHLLFEKHQKHLRTSYHTLIETGHHLRKRQSARKNLPTSSSQNPTYCQPPPLSRAAVVLLGADDFITARRSTSGAGFEGLSPHFYTLALGRQKPLCGLSFSKPKP